MHNRASCPDARNSADVVRGGGYENQLTFEPQDLGQDAYDRTRSLPEDHNPGMCLAERTKFQGNRR